MSLNLQKALMFLLQEFQFEKYKEEGEEEQEDPGTHIGPGLSLLSEVPSDTYWTLKERERGYNSIIYSIT